MELIWHGTAAIELIKAQGRLLFDPFVPLKGSEVQFGIEEYDGFSDIFLTHGHLDHVSCVPEIVRRNPDVRVHCTRTPYNLLLRRGVPYRNLQHLVFGEQRTVNGFHIQAIHARHACLPKATFCRLGRILKSPARGNLVPLLREHLLCRENDETVLYRIQADGKEILLMGSLNLREDAEYPTGADLLILPYNGWEDNYPPACRIIQRLQPKSIVLHHYDNTFPPLTEPIDLSPVLEKYGDRIQALTFRKTEAI